MDAGIRTREVRDHVGNAPGSGSHAGTLAAVSTRRRTLSDRLVRSERELPPPAIDSLRVALVHDWLTGMRGGEKCLEVLCRVFPDAQLFTLIHRRGSLSPAIEAMNIKTSVLQQVPGVFRHYRHLLPAMPLAAPGGESRTSISSSA